MLRTLKYNNTNGGPGAGAQIFVEFLADDDTTRALVRTTTIAISVPLVVDLNGRVPARYWLSSTPVALDGLRRPRSAPERHCQCPYHESGRRLATPRT